MTGHPSSRKPHSLERSEDKAVYGIIGYPVSHSLSPLMHNSAFKALNVDAVYKTFSLKEDELPKFFKDLRKKDSPIFGFNVTVPYKEKVLEYMDNLSPFSSWSMSVNTVVITPDRRLSGYNTDGPGFLAHLAELGFEMEGKRIVVLGAGGTTRSLLAAMCLLPERPASIRIYNRTHSKAQKMVDYLGQKVDTSMIEVAPAIEDLNIELADLVVNTTSVGMREDDPCLIDPAYFHSGMLAYDVIYNPAETTFLNYARARGAKVSNGLGMLFYQGVLALQHWADAEIPDEVKAKMRQSLEAGKVL